mmetsp:Transcript_3669/g.5740  ORF Transcript_3669/g.5740 Transcript_3669/m.5740 type:complete len:189 (-) Transcript_3669:5-571(-)
MTEMTDIFKHAYALVSPEERKKEWYEEVEEQVCSVFPSMTFQQRVIGCLSCLLLGFLISMGSTFRLLKLLRGDPEPFAIMYTSGNLIGIGSTCFLYGPWAQIKKMFAPTRLIATGIYLFFMGLTLFLAFYPGEIPLRLFWLVLAIFCQFLALIWYSLSFIPFAREIMKTICRETCCRNCCPAQDDGWV